MCEKYNGWTNYETWLVNLWIDNDEYSQEYWKGRAEQCCTDNEGKNDNAIYDLSKELEEELKDNDTRPLSDANNMYSDLLNAALSTVNWYEIAENMIEECDWEPEEEEDSEEE